MFVGPKELPVFLRTLGRYAGSIRNGRRPSSARHFDAAMREAELDHDAQRDRGPAGVKINAEVMGAKAADQRSGVSHAGHAKAPMKPVVESPCGAGQHATATSAPATGCAQRQLNPSMLPMPPMPAPPSYASSPGNVRPCRSA
jgi:sec-independent protein translocase protein TatB